MKLTCTLLIAFALGATSTPALADDTFLTYKPKTFPACTVYIVPGVGEFCGYKDIEDWKKALKADADLVHTRVLLAKEKERTGALALQVKALKDQVAVYASSQKVLVKRSDKLTTDIIDLDKKYQFERVKPRWGSPLAWSIAAVSTSVLAGFVLKAVFD